MAESTLAISYDDLRSAIAHFLGHTLTELSWSANDIAVQDMIIKRGLRQFYFPPKISPDEAPHEWSFLKPVTTISTIAPYSTGTILLTLADATVTLTTGTWPTWAATNGTLIVDNVEYAIASRDVGGVTIELSSAWALATQTAATYSLVHDGNYDLPDDFGGLEGNLVCESTTNKPNVIIIGEGRVRSLRQSHASSSTPCYAAVRPKEQTTMTSGQRFEIMFYPIPDDVYTYSYVKRILPQMLVDAVAPADDITYPYGGALHAETLLASCIAIADEQENSNQFDGRPTDAKKKVFIERLTASIALDKQMNSVDYFGYNGDRSNMIHRDSETERDRNIGLVTYNG